MTSRNTTRVVQVNLNHAQAAQDLLMQKVLEENVEVAAVQEPWSTTNEDYWLKSKKGTAAILWNRGVSQFPCKTVMKGMHTIAVKYRHFVLVSCYSSPNATQMEYEQLLQEIRLVVTQEKNNIVICGDFNAKSPLWSCKIKDNRGKDLESLVNMLDLRLINVGSVATCVRPQGSSIVDITWSTSDIFSRIDNWIVDDDKVSLSDHRYITFTVYAGNTVGSHRNDEARLAWSFKKFNGDLFHSVFSWECPQLKIEDLADKNLSDELSKQLDQIMKHACDAAMPRQRLGQRKRTATYWWSEEISAKRKECITYRRKWTRARKGLDRERLDGDLEKEKEYKRYKKDLRQLIRKAKITAWKNLIRTIEEDPWGLPYRLVMNKLRRNSPRITEMLEATVLNETLNKLFPQSKIEKLREFPELDTEWMEDWDISPAEIHRVTRKRTASNTAPGWDGVKFQYWKLISDEMITCTASVLTVCLRQGIFPIQWKRAQLVLIPKGPLDMENPKLRPICLLPEIGKIFERIVVDRLWDWMEGHSEAALSPNQFGFRRQRSTIDAIVEFREFIEFAQKENGTVIAAALDISNAFNSLQWADICQTLEDRHFPVYLQKLIYNYLSDRSIEYKNQDGHIITRRIEAGVPQGSVLGPLLWNLTYDRILRAKVENGCRLLAYADDTLIIATGESPASAQRRLNFQIARTCKHIKDLHLEVSASKTEIIVLTPDKKPPPTITVTVNRQLVQSKRSLKYLGVMMDDKLTFTDHLEYVDNKVTKVTKGLWRIMPNLHGPSERRRRLYANVLSSIILYAAPVWAHRALVKGRVSTILKALHRMVTLRVIAAYRTVAHDAAAIISRIPPYYLTADARKRSYERIRDLKIAHEWNKKDEKAIISDEISNSFIKWKEYLLTHNVAGVRTREAILPVWDEWIFRRHGNVGFHLTQMFTGHGVFYSYLRRIGRVTTDRCPHCLTGAIDTVDHTLTECNSWTDEREEMLRKLCMTADSLSLRNLVQAMVDSKEGWAVAQTFVGKVMLAKEERERQIERESHAISASASEDDDDSYD